MASILCTPGRAAAVAGLRRRQQHQPLCAAQQGQAGPSEDVLALTRRIKTVSNSLELLQLHSTHRKGLDDVHLSAFFVKLAAAGDGEQRQPALTGAHKRLQQQQSQRQQPAAQQQHPRLPSSSLPPQRQARVRRVRAGSASAARPLESKQQQQDGVHVQPNLRFSDLQDVQQQPPGVLQLQQQMQYPWQHQQLLLSALLQDLHQHLPSMRPRTVASILWALAKLQPHQAQPGQAAPHRRQPRLAPVLRQNILQVVPLLLLRAHQQLGFEAFEARQLCYIAYALTRLQQQQRRRGRISSTARQHQQQWDAGMLNELYAALGPKLQTCSAQDAAQAVYTMAQLQQVPPAGWLVQWLSRAHQLLPRFKAQGLANSAYGLARVLELSGQLPGQDTWATNSSSNNSNGLSAVGQDQLQDTSCTARSAVAASAVQWLQACLRVGVLHLQNMQPAELYGMLLWACGKLKCPIPNPAKQHILARGQKLLAACDTQQLATALYCFALLQEQPPQLWLEEFWSRVKQKLGQFQGLGLAKLLWAASQLHLQLPQELISQLQYRVCSQVDRSNVGCMVSALHSMVVLKLRLQERYLLRVQAVVLLRLQQFSGRDFSMMLWALAVAKVKVDDRWLERVLMASGTRLSAFSPTELSVTLWAVAELKHTPSRQWLLQMLGAMLQKLPRFQPINFANTMWALGQLESVPSPFWLNTYWSNSSRSLTRFKPEELAATVSAVVKLRLSPPVDWVQNLTVAVDRSLAKFDSKRLLFILQAVRQLQAKQFSFNSRSNIDLLQYDHNSSSNRGYIYSSSIVPFGRLQLHSAREVVTFSAPFGSFEAVLGTADHVLPTERQLLQRRTTTDVLQQLDSSASEAYSMACLVALMPDWLQARVAHWPKQLAAERALYSSSSGGSRVVTSRGVIGSSHVAQQQLLAEAAP